MRVALFVEGSQFPTSPRQQDPLLRIWNEHLAGLAGCGPFSAIHTISKVNLIQLDPKETRVSGNALPFDELIARKLKMSPGFDAAILAWDLEPPLPFVEPQRCRWAETVSVQRFLAASERLPIAWRRVAQSRLQDYETRRDASTRVGSIPLMTHEIRPLCMAPEFEDILLSSPKSLRIALGAKGQQVKRWPSKQAFKTSPGRPGKVVLNEAIEAVRRHKPRPREFPPIEGSIDDDAPNEWGEWILRQLIGQEPEVVRNHAVTRRLAELLA